MKIIFVCAVLFGVFAHSQEAQKCAAQAEGMAQIKYLDNNPGIQGHEFESQVTGYAVDRSDNSAAVEVTIKGKNDEGQTWTEKYEILLGLNKCNFAQSSRK